MIPQLKNRLISIFYLSIDPFWHKVNNMKKIIKNTYALCIPLTSTNTDRLMADYEKALSYQPDFIEWRRDAIPEKIDDIAVLKNLRKKSPNTGLIYTYRCPAEGGLTSSDEQTRLEILKTVFASNLCDYVDTESSNSEAYIHEIFRAKKTSQSDLILSYHNFDRTPDSNELKALLDKIENQSSDVIKIALTANHPEDIRRTASVLLPFSSATEKPIVLTMMQKEGSIVRAVPEIFGGSITFAAPGKASAPGQLSPSEIKTLRRLLHLEEDSNQSNGSNSVQKNIALVGYMGTGKTSVAHALSQMTGMPFVDTDQHVEALAGKTIPEIFEQDGEDAFRLLEHIVLRDILKKNGQIIATGGGIVLRENNRNLLKSKAFTVHLTANPEIIAERVAGDTNRPLLANAENLLIEIQSMLAERHPFYSGYSLTVDTNQLSIDETAKTILDALNNVDND